MSAPLFPVYRSHAVVRCFNCRTKLDGKVRPEGVPALRGKHSQRCEACKMITWYDIRGEE